MEPDQRHIGRLIKQIDNALRRQVDNDMRPWGITMSQMRVLIELRQTPEGTLTFKELEKAMGVAQSTVWGLVMRLENKGFVQSLGSSNDARVRIARITSTGLDLCEKSLQRMLEHERQLTSGLTDEETDTLFALLERVRDTMV